MNTTFENLDSTSDLKKKLIIEHNNLIIPLQVLRQTVL